jgi:hypothetical protein
MPVQPVKDVSNHTMPLDPPAIAGFTVWHLSKQFLLKGHLPGVVVVVVVGPSGRVMVPSS